MILRLPHIGLSAPDGLDRLDEGRRPLGLSDTFRAARAAAGNFSHDKASNAAFPRPAPPARRSDRRPSPPGQGATASRLLAAKTPNSRRKRREDATRAAGLFPIICRGRPRNLHRGLLKRVDLQLSASETPSPFSNHPVSYLSEPGHACPIAASFPCVSSIATDSSVSGRPPAMPGWQ